jgi:hypothetical protein
MYEISANFAAFSRALESAYKSVGFARTVALTRTAKLTAQFLNGLTRVAFDRPTPFTQGAITWMYATAVRDALWVFVKDFNSRGVPASKYLAAEVAGGTRRNKRSENALARRGLSGQWVPGSGLTLDAYGNVPGSVIRRIISDVQADSEVGYLANRTGRSRRRNRRYRDERYFIPKPGSKLHPGVWVRRGNKIEPALLFVAATHYETRYDFYGEGIKFAEVRYRIELERAIAQGFAEAKG